MPNLPRLVLAAVSLATSFAASPAPAGTVGVAWAEFSQDRWTSDERAIRSTLEAAGVSYLSADASSSAAKQFTDVEKMIADRVDALIVVAIDPAGLIPLVREASARHIPVIAYDRLVDDPSVYYISFDNAEIGRMQARAVLASRPIGDYVLLKGDPGDPNTDFLYGGQMEILSRPIASGRIRNVGEAFIAGWLPIHAETSVEAILAANPGGIDAIVASNDAIAGGALESLAHHGLAGKVAISGEDGDHDALNRIARGTQTVTVWKDTRALGRRAAEIALQLAAGTPMDKIDGTTLFRARPSSATVRATLLQPVAITNENLDVVIDAGWIERKELCADVPRGQAAACD